MHADPSRSRSGVLRVGGFRRRADRTADDRAGERGPGAFHGRAIAAPIMAPVDGADGRSGSRRRAAGHDLHALCGGTPGALGSKPVCCVAQVLHS